MHGMNKNYISESKKQYHSNSGVEFQNVLFHYLNFILFIGIYDIFFLNY